MKKLVLMTIAVFAMLLSVVSVSAAEKTEAYNRLVNMIVSTTTDGPYPGTQYYAATDTLGNVWEASFADNGNIVCLSTQIDDYEEAYSLAYRLVDYNDSGVYPYSIPFTVDLDKPCTHEIVVPVYKDISVDIICARPAYLYPSEEKTIESFALDEEKGTEIIVFYTRTTASFKAAINSGELQTYRIWGQDWFPEDETEQLNDYYYRYGQPTNSYAPIREEVKYSNDIASPEQVQAYLDKINQPLTEVTFGVASNDSFYP